MDDRHIGLIAAGVAFYAMLAVFPGMVVVIAIWGSFSDPAYLRDYLSYLAEFMPPDALHLIEIELTRALTASPSTLSWTTLVSLAVGLWSAWSAVQALVDGLNAVHAHEHRPGIMRYVAAVVLTFALIGLLLSALAAMVVVPTVINFVPLGRAETWILKALPTTVLFVGIIVFLGMFYRWGPNHDEKPSWITPGAFVSALLWALASIAFSVYIAYFGTYNRIYGSIGAAIALLMWFYISAYIVLFGGVLNAEIVRLRDYARQ